MSRIGEKSITIPTGVTVNVEANQVLVKGPKGELTQSIPGKLQVEVKDDTLTVKRPNNHRQTKAYHGLLRSLLNNMIQGVTEGYTKKLELVGTGYRAKKQGNNIVVTVGYSHPVEVKSPDGINLEMEGETIIVVSGVDKQKVGQTAAEIRSIRKPEPYKGKGIRYQNEIIRRKAGKATKVGAAA